MPRCVFKKGKIHSISIALPNNELSLDNEIDKFYNGDIKKLNRIKKNTGLNKRYISKNLTSLDLCAKASCNLIRNLKFDTNKIDALIFITQTPNYLQPNNANILHGKLNLNKDCACFDVNLGCSGYVYGMWLAFMMIECGLNYVLLCAGDTLSKCVSKLDSNTAPLFGDAGSATLIKSTKLDSNSYFILHSDGSGYENIIFQNSGFKKDEKYKNYLYMDGAEVFNFSLKVGPQSIEEILSYSNKDINDIDYIFFHQANAFIIQNIVKKLNIDSNKAPCKSISKYGNTSSSSIPLAICDFYKENKIEKNLNVILSGFGVGLSWGSAFINLNRDIKVEIDFIKEEN